MPPGPSWKPKECALFPVFRLIFAVIGIDNDRPFFAPGSWMTCSGMSSGGVFHSRSSSSVRRMRSSAA